MGIKTSLFDSQIEFKEGNWTKSTEPRSLQMHYWAENTTVVYSNNQPYTKCFSYFVENQCQSFGFLVMGFFTTVVAEIFHAHQQRINSETTIQTGW